MVGPTILDSICQHDRLSRIFVYRLGILQHGQTEAFEDVGLCDDIMSPARRLRVEASHLFSSGHPQYAYIGAPRWINETMGSVSGCRYSDRTRTRTSQVRDRTFVHLNKPDCRRLGPHPDDGKSPLEMAPEQQEAFLQREIGRRVWSALTSQDWLCSTSQGIYTLQKRHFTSLPPRHFDEETLAPIEGEDTPTYTHISNYLNDFAYTLIRYLDDMLDAPDLSTKYNVVLRYDAIVRAMAIEKMPKFLSMRTPYNPAWPEWAAWARRSYQASSAHKIIMIHQSFLGRSFKDSRYTFSRWACLSSAKTIIEAMDKRHPNEPQWWVEQVRFSTLKMSRLR